MTHPEPLVREGQGVWAGSRILPLQNPSPVLEEPTAHSGQRDFLHVQNPYQARQVPEAPLALRVLAGLQAGSAQTPHSAHSEPEGRAE